jgi:prepilin-type N-terminal cleavage/methylation domain-containing protein
MRRFLGGPFHNGRGFTLVEILLALAVSGIIMVVLSASIIQIIKVSQADSSQITAIRNLDTAGAVITRDFESAQSPLPASVNLSPGSNTLTINQSVLAPSDTTVSYTVNGSKELIRTVGSTTSLIAHSITSVVYSNGSPNTILITAIVGDKTVARTHKVVSRLTP